LDAELPDSLALSFFVFFLMMTTITCSSKCIPERLDRLDEIMPQNDPNDR
jgi:hypothetical protein